MNIAINKFISLAILAGACTQPEEPVSFHEEEAVFPCDQCDYIVSEHETNGDGLGVQPGQIVCLDAKVAYSNLVFSDLKGTPDSPILIRNCGGISRIYSKMAYGVKFERSDNFHLTGDGAGSDRFGIQITTEKGFYLTLENFTSDFEISQIEIKGASPSGSDLESGGFAGIGIKTSPYHDCTLFEDSTRQAWILRNVKIYHNYIHDTGGEGLYIGHGFYGGRKEADCEDTTWSHSIKNIQVYENLIENVGYDGIQIKNADEDVQVYNNIIRNYGTRKEPWQNEGLFIGEGSIGQYFGNIIDTGSGSGCQVQGIGNIDLYENYFMNSGENGIYITSGVYVVRWPQAYFNISRNVIFNTQGTGFEFHEAYGGPKNFTDNVVMEAGALMEQDANVEMDNNILSNDQSIINGTNLLQFLEFMKENRPTPWETKD